VRVTRTATDTDPIPRRTVRPLFRLVTDLDWPVDAEANVLEIPPPATSSETLERPYVLRRRCNPSNWRFGPNLLAVR